VEPTKTPSLNPTLNPTVDPTRNPSLTPTLNPTVEPTKTPSLNPTLNPTVEPTNSPSLNPTLHPTRQPTVGPTNSPSSNPTRHPTSSPTDSPEEDPQILLWEDRDGDYSFCFWVYSEEDEVVTCMATNGDCCDEGAMWVFSQGEVDPICGTLSFRANTHVSITCTLVDGTSEEIDLDDVIIMTSTTIPDSLGGKPTHEPTLEPTVDGRRH